LNYTFRSIPVVLPVTLQVLSCSDRKTTNYIPRFVIVSFMHKSL
jgi:hypothetical protein